MSSIRDEFKGGKGFWMQTRTRRLAWSEGIVAGTLFGTAAIFIRFLGDVDAFSIAFWRLVVAGVVLASILIVFRKSFSLNLVRKNLRDLVILSFFLGLHFIFFVSAVKDTTILNATVLVNTSPIFSVFVSSFLFKLKPSRIAILGLAISFIGVSIIAYAETATANVSSNLESFSPSLKGDLEAVVAALVESFYLNYGRKVRRQMDIIPTMLPMYLLTASFVGILSIPTIRKPLALPTETAKLLPIIGLGILPTATAHTLYFSSLSNLKSFETATMALLEPIGATILGIAIFQEMPSPTFTLGAFLILLGIFFVIYHKK
jgi:drug/metabolite transporter (DMT)-like permease